MCSMLDSFQYTNIPFVPESSKLETIPRCGGNNCCPSPHGYNLAIMVQYVVGFICHRNTLLSPFQLLVFRCFSATLLPLSSLYGCMGLFCPSCKILHLPSLKPTGSLSAHCFSLSRSFRTASLPSSILTAPHNLVLCTNLQIMPSIPLSGLLIKMLNVLAPVLISEGCHKEAAASWILWLNTTLWAWWASQSLLFLNIHLPRANLPVYL